MVRLIGRLALCVVLLLSGLGTAMTQTDNQETYYQGLVKLKREKSVEYEKQRRMFTFFTQMLLGRLGYDAGPFDGVLGDRTQAALGLYQKNRGLPITRDPLSFETSKQISADLAALEQQTISLPPLSVSTDSWDEGYVFAEGTWTLSGGKLAWPKQTSKINCLRNLGICLEATASLESGVLGWGERHLSVDLDTYQIERWDDVELVTRPRHQAPCVQHVRRIRRVQKSVTGIRGAVPTDKSCEGIAERNLILVNGLELAKKFKEKRGETWRSLLQMSPGMRELIRRPSSE